MPVSRTRSTKKTRVTRKKRERGRPMKQGYAPRIDATPEEMAKAMFSLPADHQWEYEKEGGKVYRCVNCEREVAYPETLYRDGRCEDCHDSPVE